MTAPLLIHDFPELPEFSSLLVCYFMLSLSCFLPSFLLSLPLWLNSFCLPSPSLCFPFFSYVTILLTLSYLLLPSSLSPHPQSPRPTEPNFLTGTKQSANRSAPIEKLRVLRQKQPTTTITSTTTTVITTTFTTSITTTVSAVTPWSCLLEPSHFFIFFSVSRLTPFYVLFSSQISIILLFISVDSSPLHIFSSSNPLQLSHTYLLTGKLTANVTVMNM